jgi:hypothetical protein
MMAKEADNVIECVDRSNGAWRVSRTLLLATVVLGGCGGDRGPERVVVSGTVTYNGKPLANGKIRFVPTAASQVPVSGVSFTDGAYRVVTSGGVPVGTHQVWIEGYRPIPMPANLVGPVPPHAKDGLLSQFLPKKYNMNTQLEITIQPGSREITKDFDLTD